MKYCCGKRLCGLLLAMSVCLALPGAALANDAVEIPDAQGAVYENEALIQNETEEQDASLSEEETAEETEQEAPDLYESLPAETNDMVIHVEEELMQYDPHWAIQSALSAAGNNNSMITVCVPKGTYVMDGSLTIYSNTHLKLDAQTVLKRSERSQAYSMLRASAYSPDGSSYGCARNIIVEGGVWNGNSTSETGMTSLMVFRHCQNITFKNMTITRGTHHFLNVSSSKNVNISKVSFTDAVKVPDSTVGKKLRANFECVHIDFEGLNGASDYDGTVPQGVSVTGCTFRNVYAGAGTHNRAKYRGVKSYGKNITISNNTFTNISGRCINAYQFRGLTAKNNVCKNVADFALLDDTTGTISGNRATIQPRKGVEPYAVKVMSGSSSAGLVIQGNLFSCAANRVLSLAECKYLTVRKNQLTGNKSEEVIFMRQCPKAKVLSNVIKGGKERGLHLNHCDGVLIQSNVVNPAGGVGINLTNGSSGCTVNGNQVTGTSVKATKKGICLSTGANNTSVTKNTVKLSAVGLYLTGNTGSKLTSNRFGGSGSASIQITGSVRKAKLAYNNLDKKGLKAAKGTCTVLTPRKPKVGKGKKALAVSWAKVSGATSYQLQYSAAKKFKKAKSVNLTGVKKKLTGLGAKKKYYVRVRACKKVGKIMFYTPWSTTANAKTK